MPTITAPSDFTVGEIQIANISLVQTDIQWFINKYEPLFLENIMFADLYAAYILTPTDARFVALIDSQGFKDAIRGYVYFYYQRNLVSQSVGVGESKSKATNAVASSSVNKQDKAFNDMVKSVYKIVKFITDSTDYPEYIQPQWLIWRIQQWQWDWWVLDRYWYPMVFYNKMKIPEIYNSIPLI